MKEGLNNLFVELLQQHISNPYAKAAMSLIQDDKDYEIDQGALLETDWAIEIYERRARVSMLPEKEVEELKRIVGELKLLNSSKIRIVTVMVKQWAIKRAPAYVFFMTSNFDKLIGSIQTQSPGNIFDAG
ncbi:hypothetical protein [Chitinophaga niabensis]|uniref:Uncharacterized protein n=1 Tax=Chitinophaga niabensis TaxID=536979 RepID=A0A1N6EKQ1_9BACT|nr:hypothetical protein [Chitinophaga niabensis]SIN83584.1 hypothetical protein SAMN04488055_1680 [Chitinophaga niabensis]